MKRITIISLIVLLGACNSTAPTKQQQLNKLKGERDKLNTQIARLEAAVDSTSGTNTKTVAVAVSTLEPTVFTDYIEVQGSVDAEKNVTVTAEVPAVITALYVHTGQHVSAGQTLAKLDSKVVGQQIAQLRNQLAYTKNIYDRQQNLWDQNIGTKVQLLTAKNNYENVQKQIEVQQSQLSMYEIKSPITGVVDDVIAKIGQAVSPGVPTFRVVNMTDLKVTGQIGETNISHVNTGDAVEVVFPDLQDTLHTRLTYVSKVVDEVSRAFTVNIRLPHKSVYHPNMLAVIRVISHQDKNAIKVPINVIQHDAKGDYVYISDHNKAKQVHVTISHNYGGYAEVSSGLKAGDQLITAGFENMNEGDSLQVQ
ncbi:MAG TPA: efflux RND transporter periplasmic adaptor subunit [Chitinophagaceae bacterium]|jgi:RND family efflux transporter MFP subunit|nr:efflux RND transporter periplasmic adaptor subunit [Chitinophagaceae bacterium]